MWNIPGEHAVYPHLHSGMQLAKFCQRGKQCVDRTLVHAERKLTALQPLQLTEPLLNLIAQIDQALGVVLEEGSRIGEANRPRPADEERLAQPVLQLANGQTDGRLRAVETLRRPREAALLRDHQKYL